MPSARPYLLLGAVAPAAPGALAPGAPDPALASSGAAFTARPSPISSSDSDARLIGIWLLGAAAVAYVGNQIRDFVQGLMGLNRSRRVESAEGGLTVRPAAEYVTRADWVRSNEAFERRIASYESMLSEIRKEMVDAERRANTARETHNAALHQRINQILIAIGRLEGGKGGGNIPPETIV